MHVGILFLFAITSGLAHFTVSSSSSSPLPKTAFSASATDADGAIKDSSTQNPKELYVCGVDAGTESIRVGIFKTSGEVVTSATIPWQTSFPSPGHAEQNPLEWWQSFGKACQACLSSEKFVGDPRSIVGLSIDTTACSVVVLDESFEPVRPCLLWMDARSAVECADIFTLAQGDDALLVNCDGNGPLSAEWMIPKALWIKRNEPETWAKAKVGSILFSKLCNSPLWHN